MLKLSHKNLTAWEKSLELVKEVYSLCEKLPKQESYNLSSQLKRATISVSSNIAEGFARASKKETKRFLDISRSSLVEIDTQIIICLKLEYFTNDEVVTIDELINYNFALLTKLTKSIK